MTRRARRDPRSLLELRRLAYRAQPTAWGFGRVDVREVLHDALLETFPEAYPRYIRLADRLARDRGRTYFVFFQPTFLSKKERFGPPFDVDDIHSLPFRYRTDAVVYVADPKL